MAGHVSTPPTDGGSTLARHKQTSPGVRSCSGFAETLAHPDPRIAASRQAVQTRLLSWYDRNKRDLPWRRRPDDAYAQLVAEFMLQQTQVATVVAYYDRFLGRFPTAMALATADLDEVLAAWSGLGYYRRARNLHATAQRIAAEHGGQVPADVAELTRLPGIGRYTAGAIASVALGVRVPILDGNVIRVLTRLLAMRDDPSKASMRRTLWRVAEELLPATRCGDFNQALMELGATVCTPQGPACERCPLAGQCQARARELTDVIPAAVRRPKVQPLTLVTAAIRCGDALLFVQRPRTGLWAGLWALPSEEVERGEDASLALRRLRATLPAGTRLARCPISSLTRLLTHRSVTFQIHAGTCTLPKQLPPPKGKWVHPQEWAELGVSRALTAILKAVGWPG